MAGELIVGREKFLQFAQCFCDKISLFSIKLLDLWLDDNVVGFLNSLSGSHFWRKKFRRKNFCKLVFDRENHENSHLTKFCRYTVLYLLD